MMIIRKAAGAHPHGDERAPDRRIIGEQYCPPIRRDTSFTLWHLACALYYEGNPQGAAAVLDQLTAEAQQSGDLAVEVLAMFNSAWLNGQSGNGRVAATKLESVRQLLRSPYMPVAIRDQLSARIGEPSAVAVKR